MEHLRRRNTLPCAVFVVRGPIVQVEPAMRNSLSVSSVLINFKDTQHYIDETLCFKVLKQVPYISLPSRTPTDYL